MPTRRECLQRSGLAAAALATAGCVPSTRGLSQPELEQGWAGSEAAPVDSAAETALVRTVSRTSFGPRPGELTRVREIGLNAYLEEQLHLERLEESPAVAWRLW